MPNTLVILTFKFVQLQIGYLPPEMLVPNVTSTKSDVYSYGMVLLELVGGRRNFMTVVDIESQQTQRSYFPNIVREKTMEVS
jgi:serine/threonine protein kinase